MADQITSRRLERGSLSVEVDGDAELFIVRNGDEGAAMDLDEAYWLLFVGGPAVMPDWPSAREQIGRR